MQIIALDYDGTTSEAVVKWITIADILRSYGDTIICVCSRRNTPENYDELRSIFPSFVKIIFTEHNPKKEFCEKRGIKIDVWIDNDPNSIFNSDQPDKRIPDDG